MNWVSTRTSHRIDVLFAFKVKVLFLSLCLVAPLDSDLLGQVLEVQSASVLVKLSLCLHNILYLPHLDRFILERILSGSRLSHDLFARNKGITLG